MDNNRDMYDIEVPQRLRATLEKCPDYIANPGKCKVYGSCRWMRVNLEDLAIMWIESCIRTQAYNRGNKEELLKKTETA